MFYTAWQLIHGRDYRESDSTGELERYCSSVDLLKATHKIWELPDRINPSASGGRNVRGRGSASHQQKLAERAGPVTVSHLLSPSRNTSAEDLLVQARRAKELAELNEYKAALKQAREAEKKQRETGASGSKKGRKSDATAARALAAAVMPPPPPASLPAHATLFRGGRLTKEVLETLQQDPRRVAFYSSFSESQFLHSLRVRVSYMLCVHAQGQALYFSGVSARTAEMMASEGVLQRMIRDIMQPPKAAPFKIGNIIFVDPPWTGAGADPVC
jgi:hypothetical protein